MNKSDLAERLVGRTGMAFESAEDVAEHLPRFIDSYNERRLHSALEYPSPNRYEEKQPRTPVKTAA
ncbi:MAG: integrase core domain-containing protein [Rhodospirillaceae bacterium]|nr:integrase core domain-containing protein [Rhodospirillaceae bacterium]